MDWNIFFSAVSQTSGAIVGIFAAFLITKIVSNQADFKKNIEKISNYILKSKAIEHETEIRHFDWYNARIADREIDKIDEMYQETKEILNSNEYYDALNFSPFQSKNNALILIQNKVDELLEEKKKKDEERAAMLKALGPGKGWLSQDPMRTLKISNLNSSPTNNVTDEREVIGILFVRASEQANLNQELLTTLQGGDESSSLVSVSIFAVLLLFFSGVIYPLSFLPLDPEKDIVLSIPAFLDILFSLKGFLMTVISIIFSSLMILFLVVNNKLKHDKENLNSLKHYSVVSNYSTYFKNYTDNKNTLNE